MVSAWSSMRGIQKGGPESTRRDSRHTEIYTLSLHDALPILEIAAALHILAWLRLERGQRRGDGLGVVVDAGHPEGGSGEHTAGLQAHRDLHSFPTRRSSDLGNSGRSSHTRLASP